MTDVLEYYQKGKQQTLCAMMWRMKGLYEFYGVLTHDQFMKVADCLIEYAETGENRKELVELRDKEVKG